MKMMHVTCFVNEEQTFETKCQIVALEDTNQTEPIYVDFDSNRFEKILDHCRNHPVSIDNALQYDLNRLESAIGADTVIVNFSGHKKRYAIESLRKIQFFKALLAHDKCKPDDVVFVDRNFGSFATVMSWVRNPWTVDVSTVSQDEIAFYALDVPNVDPDDEIEKDIQQIAEHMLGERKNLPEFLRGSCGFVSHYAHVEISEKTVEEINFENHRVENAEDVVAEEAFFVCIVESSIESKNIVNLISHFESSSTSFNSDNDLSYLCNFRFLRQLCLVPYDFKQHCKIYNINDQYQMLIAHFPCNLKGQRYFKFYTDEDRQFKIRSVSVYMKQMRNSPTNMRVQTARCHRISRNRNFFKPIFVPCVDCFDLKVSELTNCKFIFFYARRRVGPEYSSLSLRIKFVNESSNTNQTEIRPLDTVLSHNIWTFTQQSNLDAQTRLFGSIRHDFFVLDVQSLLASGQLRPKMDQVFRFEFLQQFDCNMYTKETQSFDACFVFDYFTNQNKMSICNKAQ